MATIRQTAQQMNVSEMYVRKLIKEGKLQSSLEVIPGTKIERHNISEASIIAFQKRASNRSSRDDGRNKFTLYATPKELEAIFKAINASDTLKNFNAAELITRANPPKNS